MALSPPVTAMLVLTILAALLLASNIALAAMREKGQKTTTTCTPRTSTCGSRPPTCDFNEYQTDATLPTPTPGTSTGYDWLAANYALNLFGEGVRAYVTNDTPRAFPRTRSLGTLSGVDVPNPTSVKKRRMHNIAWMVKVDGQAGAADQIYVIWRGTQGDPEWLINADIVLVPWSDAHPGVLVHKGYDEALKEVRDELYATLKSHITRPDNTVVYMSGLSLGGGLSTVAAADLVTRSQLGLKDVRLYAFSAPRTGNQAFVDMMKEANKPGGALVDMFTIVNGMDIIPMMPPDAVGYAPLPQLTFAADWGDGTNNHLSAVQFAHIDRVARKCPPAVAPPDIPLP
jgi:hypothetical protein